MIIGAVLRTCPYAVALALAAMCCGKPSTSAPRDTLVVYLAASLTRPLQPALDTFAAKRRVVIQRESGASLEHARKLTELHRVPDLIALADVEVFSQLLMPEHVRWYAEFARNRMIVGYTDKSRHAAALDSSSWTRILTLRDVQVGRPDPDLAPAGYRALLMLQLAERFYKSPGLAARILANAPRRNMRPNAAELAVLLTAGELDYVLDYESVARAYGFHYLRLPAAIDLGDPTRAADYAVARVRVRASSPHGDSLTFTGEPIVYGLSVPIAAPHQASANDLAAFLLSRDGRAMMRAAHVDAIDGAPLIGANAPDVVRAAAAR